MKKNWRNKLILLLALLLPLGFTACQEKHVAHVAGVEYTCPMHPQIVRDTPGDCPVCGMFLVPKQTPATVPDSNNQTTTSDLNYLLQPTDQAVVATIATTQPVEKALEKEIQMNGVVTYDTRRQFTIPARIGGRIEKLYVQFNFQPIQKGQRLFDIYSPELVTAQKEFIYLLQNDAANTELIQGAKQRLRYLGATESQLHQLARTRRETYTFPVYSPYNGYVVDPEITTAPTYSSGNTTSATSGNMGMGSGGMGNSSNNNPGGSSTVATPSQGFSVREGMYVTPGQTLFKVINAEQVWAEFNVTNQDALQLKKGTPLTISFNQLPGQNIQTQIDLIQPYYEAEASFAKVRAQLPAHAAPVRVGQLVSGKTTYATGIALWVPQAAVLDLGTTAVTFVKREGVFRPVPVMVGDRAGELVQIKQGLDAQSQIATNAQFLVDSESFVRVPTRGL